MTWVKLDDGFMRHPKTRSLSHRAIVLHIAGLCYCAAQLTDGRIDKFTTPMLLAEARCSKTALSELVTARLWLERPNYYQIHDYLEYQESRHIVLARREKWANKKRGQRGGLSPGDTPGDSTGESHAPVPSRPVPSSNSTYENNSHHPHGGDMTTDENIEIVARAVVDWRSKDADVRDRTKYHRKAVPSVIAEHGERIRELLEAFPLAPVDSIVYAIETGDTRNLANSCAVGNVVELVQSERLTREQRIAAMEAQGAPKRFIDRRGSTS